MPVFVSSLEGNKQKLDGGSMFGNAPKMVWEKWLPPDELGRVELACRSLLIEIEGTKILCETGVGAYFEPKMADRYGIQNGDCHLLLKSLSDRGISEKDIDYVILSHLHFDHAGGLFPGYADRKAGANALLFSNAKYIVGKKALERNKAPHKRDRASFISELPELLENSGRMIVIDGDNLPEELSKFISFIYTDGHTPGQMHTIVTGQNSKMLFCGDMVPGKAWVHIPITMGYDRFPELLIDEKVEFLTRAAADNWMLFYTHDPDVAASGCKFSEKGRLMPIDDNVKLDRYQL